MTHSSPVNAEALAEAFADACFAGHADGPSWSTVYHNMRSLSDALRIRAQQTASPENAVWDFAKAILHGDDEHRAWLLEAAAAFEAGKPIPAPRGSGIRAQQMPSHDDIARLIAENIEIECWSDGAGCVDGISKAADDILSAFTSPEHQISPGFIGSLPSGESDPAVTPDCAGADTAIQPQQMPIDAVLAAVSKVVSSRDDLGQTHFEEIRDAILSALSRPKLCPTEKIEDGQS